MRILLVLLLSLSFTMAGAQSPQAVTAYIERYKAIAIEEMKMYGIPASVTLAQGIHESGCGCSALAINSNNHFGIKCHEEWSGQTYHHDDDQPQECFRVYNCPEESFRDHSEFLKNRPRYASLFSLGRDYRAWAKGLKAAGYATNPRYPEIIIKLIEDYNLTQFDNGNTDAVTKAAPKVNSEIDLIKQSLLQSTATAAPTPTEVKPTPAYPKTIDLSKSSLEERSVNGVRAVVYKGNVPVAFLAQKYNLSVQLLYAYNDMEPGDRFTDNDLVYIAPKKPESPYNQYEVTDGETLRSISQKFAVQLSQLQKRNELPSGCEPVAGEILVLRGKREVPIKFRLSARKESNPAKSAVQAPPPDIKVHTVGSSETLYSISKEYNIPLDTLKKINGLKDEDIKIGQTLVVVDL
jgi:LysM repeat protein